jgi:hypothetical protein
MGNLEMDNPEAAPVLLTSPERVDTRVDIKVTTGVARALPTNLDLVDTSHVLLDQEGTLQGLPILPEVEGALEGLQETPGAAPDLGSPPSLKISPPQKPLAAKRKSKRRQALALKIKIRPVKNLGSKSRLTLAINKAFVMKMTKDGDHAKDVLSSHATPKKKWSSAPKP